jgi:hypothetical protein
VGTNKQERYIPVGTVLTVVGELARSNVAPSGFAGLAGQSGKLVLRKPLEGPFLASSRSLQQLHDELAGLSKTLHWWAWALGGVGTLLVGYKLGRGLHRRWLVWQAKQKLRKELARRRQQLLEEARGAGAGEGEQGGGEGEEGEPSVCAVCLEGSLDVVWVPCGHLCLCQRCMANVARCPRCRTRGRALKVFRP